MTPAEEQDYDARRGQITELMDRMMTLQQSHREDQH